MREKFKSHFINLYFLALCDGNVDPRELDTIIKIAEEKGFTQNEFEQMIVNPTQGVMSIPENFMDKISFLYDFVRVILTDDVVEEEEMETFLKLCNRFGFQLDESNELFQWLLDLAKKNLPADEIKNEIQKLIQ